jgi:hypothetical protein
MLRQSKTHITDYAVLTRYGCSGRSGEVDTAAVESGIIGGYKQDALYTSIAAYAKRLNMWQSCGRWTDVYVQTPHYDVIHSESTRGVIRAHITEILGLSNVALQDKKGSPLVINPEGYPAVMPLVHNYNVFPRLLKAFNVSLDKTFRVLIDESLSPSTLSGRLGRFVTLLERARIMASEDSTEPAMQKPRVQSALLNFIRLIIDVRKTSNQKGCDNIYDYLSGGLNLFPPFNPGVSVELISFVRDMTLYVFERSRFFNDALLTSSPLELIAQLQLLERITLIECLSMINHHFDGLVIHD